MTAMKFANALHLGSGLSSFAIPGVATTISFLSQQATPLLHRASGQTGFSTNLREPWLCPASVSSLRGFTSVADNRDIATFTYRIAASYSGKHQILNPDRNLFQYDPFVRIKRTADKRFRPESGQDAFFVGRIGDTGGVAFGVADGVGGWVESGVDPADFSHGLCEYMAETAHSFPEGFRVTEELHSRELLQTGYSNVMQDEAIGAGGSTACIATAKLDGSMEVANLGDSGFIHIGLNAVRFSSPPQTHAFNTPYQLSKIPKRIAEQMRLFSSTRQLADLPKDAAITNHKLRHGDILVFATDGVWDNLSSQDTLSIVSRQMNEMGAWIDTERGSKISKALKPLTTPDDFGIASAHTIQAVLALSITKEAKEASLNRTRDGPFAREVQKYYAGERWHGGKPDDICVVVVIVVEN